MATFVEQLFYSAAGQAVAAKVGLPEPEQLRRGRTYIGGDIALGSLTGSQLAADTLAHLGLSSTPALRDDHDEVPTYGTPLAALVVDACGLHRLSELEGLRAVLRPAVKKLGASGRIIILADDQTADLEAGAVRQAFDGINRTVGKELRHGATTNLVYVGAGLTASGLASTFSFLLQGRSAFVDGQAWLVQATPEQEPAPQPADPERPLADKIVVVTGSARGIGAQIAEVAARDGATVVCVDVPAASEALASVANRLSGTALQLDITAADAGERIAAHVASRYGTAARIHAMVHNAGITRDKLLVNTDAARWAAVIEVNVAAQLRINQALLDSRPGGLADDGRLVSIASTSGIAGNRGQANYAASKAAVVGLVRGLADELDGRGITVNAVAPGFIETEMTAKIPFVQREIFRRTNSLGQGGKPVDVAETIGYFLDPASAGVTGQIIRVCGQNLVGA